MSASVEAELPTGTECVRASERELLIRRVFRARPLTVFVAMTEADYLRRWWAPRGLGVELFEVEADVRVGGRYRYVFGKHGEPRERWMAFSGTYTEVVRGQRVVYTQVFEPMPLAGEGLITAEYWPLANGAHTLLVQRERYPSKEVLDGAIASGMERGMRETLEQLAELAPQLDPEIR